MAFASPSSTIPKPVIAIQSNSYRNLGPEPGQQKSPTSTRHAEHTEQHDDNTHPLPSPQSSSQSVYGITTAGTNPSLGSPSSWSIPNVSHPSRSLSDVMNSEPYPSCALSSSPVEPQSQRPNSPPHVTSKNEISTSHPKNHVFPFPSIRDLKRLSPAFVLQNSGSVARDHLASERTFLAYVHTSLALATAGVGIVQLFTIVDLIIPNSSDISMMETSRKLQRFAMPLGALSQVLALFILFLGEWVYSPFFFFAPRLRQR